MQQAIQRIDHIVILVKPENLPAYADRLGGVLGITFDEPIVSASGTMVTFCWDAGLEIIAPTREEGLYWERLQRFGEGTVTIIFGVADMEEGKRRVEANGGSMGHEAKMKGDEEFLKRFSSFREARLNVFGDDFACLFGLSEIVPAETD
jgi:predicted enzyme related to lactoylglutathione lyase